MADGKWQMVKVQPQLQHLGYWTEWQVAERFSQFC